MLLGFGLDAFVLIGTSSDGPHNWVLTRASGGGKNKYVFWESLTGQRYEQKDPRVNNLYRSIGTAYNHKSLFANIQTNDSVNINIIFFMNLNYLIIRDFIQISILKTLVCGRL